MVGGPRSRWHRVVDAAFGRAFGLPPATSDYTVTRDLPITMRDGVVLLADHFAPAGNAAGTVLIRSPYGFATLTAALFAGPYAARGYHVVLARVRGTFGSGGAFAPMQHEVSDGADTVAWLREQPWFEGRFATVGPSYLGFTQWALLMDPPPEMVTAIIQVGPHDFHRSVYAGGLFGLADLLGWADQVSHQEEVGFLRGRARQAGAGRRQRPALHTLPVTDAADALCEGRADWFRDWVSRRDPDDEFWAPMRLAAALDRVGIPVLLQTGWQDIFLRQTLEQYARLHARGIDVALTVGPWTHMEAVGSGGSLLVREGLDWFAEHLAGTGTRMRWTPVRVQVTGSGEWRDLPEWPPPTTERELRPRPGGALGPTPAPAGALVHFTYDPADPTPTIGGRLLGTNSGYRDDTELARRADVLTFTGDPLPAAVEVVGTPVLELAHSSDNPHADLSVRISEVDGRGRSHNVSDAIVRLDPESTDEVVRIELDAIAHRFAAGNRIRLLVAGGSFPRKERNLGTGDDPATGTKLMPSHRTITLSRSRLLLPVRA